MKRFLAVLLGCILVCSAAGALADELADVQADTVEAPETLEDAIRIYLDDLGYKYTYDEAERRFHCAVSITSNLRNTDVVIAVKDDGFTVYAYSPIGPDQSSPEQLALAAEYLSRANSGLYVGNFELNYETGEVRFKASTRSCDRIPSYDEIMVLVRVPIKMMERYGNGLVNVMLAGADPAKMIEEAEK